MPGNYVVNPRSNGESIDAPKYLADHQLHIDNLEPGKIDDYSASVGQMQASTDPGELSSESQATALSGELERLRWAIRQATGMVQWYQTPPTDLLTVASAINPTTLTNRTGAGLVVGDVVGLDEGNDSSVKLIDTVGSLWPPFVVRGTIANAAPGPFANIGLLPTLVIGAVVRGHFLRKSAVSKALEDMGVASGHTQAPPPGAVAVAAAANAGPGGGLIAALFSPSLGGQGTGQGADLAAAATLTPGLDGRSFVVTGNTGITAISTLPVGTRILLRFTGTPLLTHNGTSLILQGGTNLQLIAGDIIEFLSLGSGNWAQVTPVMSTTNRIVGTNVEVLGQLRHSGTASRHVLPVGADKWGV